MASRHFEPVSGALEVFPGVSFTDTPAPPTEGGCVVVVHDWLARVVVFLLFYFYLMFYLMVYTVLFILLFFFLVFFHYSSQCLLILSFYVLYVELQCPLYVI